MSRKLLAVFFIIVTSAMSVTRVCMLTWTNSTIRVHVRASAMLPMYIDIKPGSWPNPINVKTMGVLPVAVCGTKDFDVKTIDPTTIELTLGADDGVAPIRWSYEDVATPYIGEPGGGHASDGDGVLDLTLKFDTQTLIEILDLYEFEGDTITIILGGNLKAEYDGTPIQGQDHVWILPLKGK